VATKKGRAKRKPVTPRRISVMPTAPEPSAEPSVEPVASEDLQRSADRPFIVGIGASAGGLRALETFFESMPIDSGMAFVIVTHQQPNRTSLLPALLGRRTRMPVETAADHGLVEPNHVYVSSAGKNIAMLNGVLHLMELAPGAALHLPIDYFFRSLACDQEDRAICIVLSGTGTDGTLGLRAIKAQAGMAMVQDELSANYPGMPHSAAGTLLADYVLPPEKMPASLLAYAQTAQKLAPASGPRETELDEVLPKIYVLLRNRLGHDFSRYKQNTMRRRIERRMRVHHIEHPTEYVHVLQAEPHELDLLFQELLITVTQFFRDPQGFEALAGRLAERIGSATEESPLRVWVPACSTGEEPYSIAMLAIELAERAGVSLHLQVFATDLDSSAIEVARTGIYAGGIAADLGADRLKRFFAVEGTGYRINKAVRERVVFAAHNVLRDPPFTKLDLLSCRNLLIYLNAELQQRLFPLFHYALEPGGILWLGTSESATGHAELFVVSDRQWKLYLRRDDAPGTAPVFDMRPSAIPRVDLSLSRRRPEHAPRPRIANAMESVLLERFAPPTLVVNERGDIAHIHGRTGAYLEPSEGEPRHNIFAMAREGLQLHLQSLVRKAIAEDHEVVQTGISVQTNGSSEPVTVIASKIGEPESLRGLVRVSFESTPSAPDITPSSAETRSKRARSLPLPSEEARQNDVDDSLSGTLAALQKSNEELKSANEELQSLNEELQSANEELESSKEELQSLNEELETVNTEYQLKLDELAQLNDDMQNMLNGTDIATLFLDGELRIKRFTEQARRVVRLIATDVGRPIGDLVPQVRYDRLTADAQEVLRSLVAHEVEVQTLDGRWLLVRILPYRTNQNVIDGVVITFVDIDRVKRAEVLAASRAFAESIVRTVREPLVVLDSGLQVVSSNLAFARLIGRDQLEIEGRSILELGTGPSAFDRLQPQLEALVERGVPVESFELTGEFAGLGGDRMLLHARRLEEDIGSPVSGRILVVLDKV
jgi:two-component system, chemotaxis family, CheB/CheR fusion protein